MRVFVTGASGWVGSATVPELLAQGHQVLALARSDATAASLKEMGAEVIRGDIENLEVLQAGASMSDAVVYLAFASNFDNFERDCANERAALQAMADVMENSNKPLVMTTGTLSVSDLDGSRGGEVATEDSPPAGDAPPFSERTQTENLILELAKNKGIKGMVMRLSPTVHGKGDPRFITNLGEMARKNGKAVYVGDGKTRWPAVHQKDTAALYRLAVEKGTAGGIYHAVSEQGVSMRQLMETIAKQIGVPVESQSQEEASQAIGMFAKIITIDGPVSSERTKKELGWEPKEAGILEDIQKNYFL